MKEREVCVGVCVRARAGQIHDIVLNEVAELEKPSSVLSFPTDQIVVSSQGVSKFPVSLKYMFFISNSNNFMLFTKQRSTCDLCFDTIALTKSVHRQQFMLPELSPGQKTGTFVYLFGVFAII